MSSKRWNLDKSVVNEGDLTSKNDLLDKYVEGQQDLSRQTNRKWQMVKNEQLFWTNPDGIPEICPANGGIWTNPS
ncbi:hypothetical protein [Evansella clarkii]|uniref:hypothetical protein n=1 Tax=Evansella clarkii TaxID=79879 RepID=UPI0011163972|nr:hypothetical protein [Evansella clarkii]